MKAPAILLAALAAAGCATDASTAEDRRPVSYECGQVVVVGRISTQESEVLDGDGIAWSAISSATIYVKGSLAGSSRGATLPVSYTSHAQLRDDIDFMFVLAPNPNNKSYGIMSASLMDTRPHLVQPCTPPAKPDAAA